MIKITHFEILDTQFKIFYEYFGEKEMKIIFYIKDAIFNSVIILNSNVVVKGVKYWTTFPASSLPYCNTHFTMGINLIVTDEQDNIIHQENFPFILTDFKKRDLSKPNFWVIGDSHVGFLFDNIKKEDLITNKYIINHICHLELSLNLFEKSDWKSFLKSIPIREGDAISFFLGEIDLRFSIIWKTKHIINIEQRKINLWNILKKLLEKYVLIIKEIKNLYPKCKIIILTPNSPIRDGILRDNNLIIDETENDRLFLFELFNIFFEENKDIWDCMSDYIDNEGFMKNELLLENNHHVSDGRPFIERLKQKIDLL